MRSNLIRSILLSIVLLFVCAVIYPLCGWALSQAAFNHQANGSIMANGSSLIGQPWNDGTSINPLWFNGRPDPYNPLYLNGKPGTSGAANLGPRSKVLVSTVAALVAEWKAVGVNPTPDLVTSSGSGLDPNITEQDAMVQVAMVAHSRHLAAARVETLVKSMVHGAQFGFLGEPTINVLALNTALAHLAA